MVVEVHSTSNLGVAWCLAKDCFYVRGAVSSHTHAADQYRITAHPQKAELDSCTYVYDVEYIFSCIRSSLEFEAATWFSIIQDTCHNFDEFRAMFLQKYWDEVVQSKIRTNLTMEKFDPSKTSSREELQRSFW
ncbi:hypothetical protein Trydic_g21670 [Trypoxylus dichotomus]